jgi:hypothetical protein
MAGGTERIAWRGAAIVGLIASLVLGTSYAFANTQLCRQLEAQLAVAAASGDSAEYVKYDRAVAVQQEQLRKARGQARSTGCRFSLSGARNWCGSLNITIERMEQNLAVLQSQRSQLAESGNVWGEQARLTASLDANGCRDSAMTEQNVPPLLEEGGGPSQLEQLIDDAMEQEAFPEEEASSYARHVIVSGPSEEPDSAYGRARPGADTAASAPEHPHAGSVITLGAPPATTKLPPPGERKVRVVGPVFLPDPEGAIDLRAPDPMKAR